MLTPAQKILVKAAVLADPTANAFFAVGDNDGLAGALNTPAAPDFWCWRRSVSESAYLFEVSPDGTSMTIGGTAGGMTARSVPELMTWERMFALGFVDPSLPNVRAAFTDVFSGAGAGAQNNRAHLLASSRRKASFIEKVLTTGTGSTAAPATLVYEGPVAPGDLTDLVNLP